MNELRLHLACEPKKTNPPDIEQALKEFEEINKDPRKWARFEAKQFAHERVVTVDWGVVHSNGMKETSIQTIIYFLGKNKKVETIKSTHY